MTCRVVLWMNFLIILNLPFNLESSRPWGVQPLYPSSLISESALNPRRAIVRKKIVLYHNFFRTKVQPPASNMLLMSWHEGAARQAKRYANKCIFLKHNDPKENTVPNLGSCGQNIFVSEKKTPWFFAIKTWFLEYQNFTYGIPIRDIHEVGHYTQMTWATSHKVGCAVSYCRGGPWGQFYNYICHYCPTGNIETKVQFPYKVGVPCADCPFNCLSGKLCTNPCPAKDFYNNCGELTHYTNNVCKQGVCNATCMCGDRYIHLNYPWY